VTPFSSLSSLWASSSLPSGLHTLSSSHSETKRVSEWYHSRRLPREHRLRKDTENEARTECTADIGAPDTPTPTTVSFPSPVTPNVPEMRSRSNYVSICHSRSVFEAIRATDRLLNLVNQQNLVTRKHFEYSRGANPISAYLQTGVLVATRPAPPVPSLPASPPTAAQGPSLTSGNGNDGLDVRTLAHKHISNTKLLFAHQFNLFRARGVPPGPSDGNDRDTNRNGGGGRRFAPPSPPLLRSSPLCVAMSSFSSRN
jgi:hypothetical protein